MSNGGEPYRLTIEIPGLPKTVNSMGRAHWTIKAKEARLWRRTVVFAIGASRRPPKPLKRARLTLTRCSSCAIDWDNMVHSFKHVVDGLVDAKVIENDRIANIGHPTVRWERALPKHGSIRIVVEEVLDGEQIDKHEADNEKGCSVEET